MDENGRTSDSGAAVPVRKPFEREVDTVPMLRVFGGFRVFSKGRSRVGKGTVIGGWFRVMGRDSMPDTHV